MELSTLIAQRKKKETNRPKPISGDKKKEMIKKYTTFYRRNVNIYCEKRLGIIMKPFQHIMLYLMNKSTLFIAIASRGIGKSFMLAVFATARCMLYPRYKVVIVSSTISQGKIIVDKIQKELCNGISPMLTYLYQKKLIEFKSSSEEITVKFLMNGSEIKVLPPLDSSRGNRAHLIIYDEFRLLKRNMLESIFEGMLFPYTPLFAHQEKYADDPTYIGEPMSCYISSSGWKTDWLWNLVKGAAGEMLAKGDSRTNVFAGDIYVAILHGLKTRSEYFKQKKNMSDITFRIEYLNQVVGESEDAYFGLEQFRRNQILHKAFRPPTIDEFMNKVDLKNTVKKEHEIRMLAVDFAFASSTGATENDNTVIHCLSLHPHDDMFMRNLDYSETHAGSLTDTAQLRIRELYQDYQADYIVMDLRNGGEVMYNDLTKEFIHPMRSSRMWNKHGFTVCKELDLHIVADNKVTDLIQRTVDIDAIPCIIPITATAEQNSNIWQELQRRLRNNEFRFLIDELELEQSLSEAKNAKWWLQLTSHERMLYKLPYIETVSLIFEAINLSHRWLNGLLKLEEPRSGTKDRIVALAYGNYIATLIENKYAKSMCDDSFNMDAWAEALLS